MTGPSPPPVELETWKQIAKYLDISVREALYRAKEEGLPVHRGTGKRGPVWALTSELEAWNAARRRLLTDPAPTSRDYSVVPQSAEPGVCIPDAPLDAQVSPQLPGDQENHNSPNGSTGPFSQISPDPTRLLSRRNVLAGTLVGVGGILASGAALKNWHPREMAMLSVDGPVLIARDASGRELWRHLFKNGLFRDYYEPAKLSNAYWIGDLDGDGHAEALFRYDGVVTAGTSSSLYCFSRSGDVKWVFHPGRAVRDSSGEIHPLYHILTFLVSFSGGPDHRARIAVSSVHPTDQPCQIALLDASGRLVAEYWHPGQLFFLVESRAGFGGAPRIIAGGVNNGEHRATLVVLDPFAMKGASTPSRMRDQAFRLLDMHEAHEELVVLFARSCLSRDEPYTRVSEIGADQQSVRVKVTESHDLSPRIVYYDFDPSLVLRRVLPSSEYREEHLRLERSGQLTHSAAADEADLERGLEIRRKMP